MAFSGGTFSRLYNWVTDKNAGVKIRADKMDAEMDGMATGLTNCVLKDGSQTITANLPMNSKKLTGLAAGSSAGDSVRYEQVALASQLGVELLASGTVSAAATLDIDISSWTAYRGFKFILSGWQPATDAASLYMRFSIDGGSTFESSSYQWVYEDLGHLLSAATSGSSSGSQIFLLSNVDAAAGTQVNIEVMLLNPFDTSLYPQAHAHGSFFGNSVEINRFTAAGALISTDDVTDVRFLFSTGNISAGKYAVQGLL